MVVIKQHILRGSNVQLSVIKVVGVIVVWMHKYGFCVGVVMVEAGEAVGVEGTANVVLGVIAAETEPMNHRRARIKNVF
jgi:hypothetical protein